MKLVKNGWVRYYWTGVAIQHVYQAALLGAAIAWTFNRCAPPSPNERRLRAFPRFY